MGAKDPTKRYSARSIKKHPWIRKYFPETKQCRASTSSLPALIVKNGHTNGEIEGAEIEQKDMESEENNVVEDDDVDTKEECCVTESLQARYNKLRGNMNYVRSELSSIVKMEEADKMMHHVKELNKTVSQYVYV